MIGEEILLVSFFKFPKNFLECISEVVNFSSVSSKPSSKNSWKLENQAFEINQACTYKVVKVTYMKLLYSSLLL